MLFAADKIGVLGLTHAVKLIIIIVSLIKLIFKSQFFVEQLQIKSQPAK